MTILETSSRINPTAAQSNHLNQTARDQGPAKSTTERTEARARRALEALEIKEAFREKGAHVVMLGAASGAVVGGVIGQATGVLTGAVSGILWSGFAAAAMGKEAEKELEKGELAEKESLKDKVRFAATLGTVSGAVAGIFLMGSIGSALGGAVSGFLLSGLGAEAVREEAEKQIENRKS